MALLAEKKETSSDEKDASDLIELDVFLQSLEILVIEEDHDFPWFDLFSSIGGVLGLFLGTSIFSFIGLCDFLLAFALKITCRRPQEHL